MSEQRIVEFEGDELIAVQPEDGVIYVHLNRLCDNLGLGRRGQVQRIQRHAVLSKGLKSVSMDTEGGTQEVQCLRLDRLPLWLSGVQANKVKPKFQEKLIKYQEEAADVLWAAFRPQIVPSAPSEASLAHLQQIAEMGRAITRMAEQQMEFERQQAALKGRMDRAAAVVGDMIHQVEGIQVRLGMLEGEREHEGRTISEAQATEIALTVKNVAKALEGQGNRNAYAVVYGELYRRFGVSSYKALPLARYDGALAWLKQWYEEIGKSS